MSGVLLWLAAAVIVAAQVRNCVNAARLMLRLRLPAYILTVLAGLGQISVAVTAVARGSWLWLAAGVLLFPFVGLLHQIDDRALQIAVTRARAREDRS